MMISSCFPNQWKVGSLFRIFQQKQPQELDPMWNPTRLDWNMCSISWATLATGSLTIGSQMAQLMRFQRRKSKLQPSWTTCLLRWIMQCPNAAESISWKMFASDLESHQMNSSTISVLLLTDATSHQMRKRNGTSSTDTSEPWMTRNSSRSCLHLTWRQQHLDAWSVPNTHCHLRQPRGHGIEGTKDSKCHKEAKQKPRSGKKPPADSVHSGGHCTKSHPPGWSSCPAWDDICHRCGKKGHWKPKCRSGHKTPKFHNKGGRWHKRVNEVGTNDDPHCDEVGVVAVVLQAPPHKEWLTNGHKRSGADPDTIEISDVWIDSTTEAFATIQMPAEIGPNQLATLKYKVDTGVGGNIMPLRAFTKLFPRHINTDGSPRGLKSSTTCLTAYNESKIPQFRTLDTAIDWTPKGQKVANHRSTDTMVHSRHTRTSHSQTPIMCQTWHCGTQLCSQPSEEEVGAAEGSHNRTRTSQTKIWNLHPSTPKKTSSRHIQIDSKELAISQEHTTSPYAVMQNPSYMHHRSAQLLCGHWCKKN